MTKYTIFTFLVTSAIPGVSTAMLRVSSAETHEVRLGENLPTKSSLMVRLASLPEEETPIDDIVAVIEKSQGLPKSGRTLLHLSAMSGDPDSFLCWIKKGANVYVKDNKGSTPFDLAKKEGHIGICWLLFLAGKNVKREYTRLNWSPAEGPIVDSKGRTPLHYAAMVGNAEACLFFIREGADVNAKDNKGSTPFDLTKKEGHIGICWLLFLAEKEVKREYTHLNWSPAEDPIVDSKGRTPLHYAAMVGNAEACLFFIREGADVDAKDNQGSTPLSLAVQKGYADVCSVLLVGGAKKHERYGNCYKLLHSATKGGHVDVYRLLVEPSADETIQGRDGNTFLHTAAKKGHKAMCSFLIEKGFEVNAQSGELRRKPGYALSGVVETYRDPGLTPLYWAVERDHVDVYRLLVKHGADETIQGRDGNTFLHTAAKKGHEAMCSFLIKRGFKVNELGYQGKTPLHLAAVHGHDDLFVFLVKKGASLEAYDEEKYLVWRRYNRDTTFSQAFKNGHTNICLALCFYAQKLNAKKNPGYSALHHAAKEGSVEVCLLAMDSKIAIHYRDSRGFTPLYYAAKYGHTDVCQMLIKHGAKVNDVAEKGITPLHLAAKYGYIDVCEMLLNRGAEVNASNVEGDTSLHLAADGDFPYLCLAFIAKGADTGCKNKYGRTPLGYMDKLKLGERDRKRALSLDSITTLIP